MVDTHTFLEAKQGTHGGKMKITKRKLRNIIESAMSESRYRDKKYRRDSDGSDMIVGDSGATEYYRPSDPIRGPGNIYLSIRDKVTAQRHGRQQISHVIQALGLDRSKARELFRAMNAHGYMIDYDPAAMTITFEGSLNPDTGVRDPYVLKASHLR